MLLQTALVAVYPNSSLNTPSVAIAASRQTACRCRFGSSSQFFAEGKALTVGVVFSRASGRGKRGDSFGLRECHPVRIPSSARGHASGLSAALQQARSSASPAATFGLRFPPSADSP
jgi:hypothetical protein